MSTQNSNNTAIIHHKYIILILILIIIGIVSFFYSESPEFTQYLATATGITSLFLGLVAIFYSFITNNSSSKNLAEISIASNELKNASLEINGSIKKLENNLSRNINEMINENKKLSLAIENIDTKTSTIGSSIEEIQKKSFAEADLNSNNTSQRKDNAEKLSHDQYVKFFQSSPRIVRIMLYICAVSQDEDKYLNGDSIGAALSNNGAGSEFNAGYFLGTIISARSLGLLKIITRKNSKSDIKISEMTSEIKLYILNDINSNSKTDYKYYESIIKNENSIYSD